VAQGDKVVFRATLHGTHQGVFLGGPGDGENSRIYGYGHGPLQGWENRRDVAGSQFHGAFPATRHGAEAERDREKVTSRPI